MTLPRERTPAIWSGPVIEHRATLPQKLREWLLDVLRLRGGQLVHRASAASADLFSGILAVAAGAAIVAFPLLVLAALLKVLACLS